MEKLRDQFVRETEQVKLEEVAEAMQVRATEWAPYIHLGQWVLLSAARKNTTGFIVAGPTVFWTVEAMRVVVTLLTVRAVGARCSPFGGA
jgi:ABC-type transport system substrate-binding protein